MCVRHERERERERRETETDRERDRERESVGECVLLLIEHRVSTNSMQIVILCYLMQSAFTVCFFFFSFFFFWNAEP